jgi:hypothetical protein
VIAGGSPDDPEAVAALARDGLVVVDDDRISLPG